MPHVAGVEVGVIGLAADRGRVGAQFCAPISAIPHTRIRDTIGPNTHRRRCGCQRRPTLEPQLPAEIIFLFIARPLGMADMLMIALSGPIIASVL